MFLADASTSTSWLQLAVPLAIGAMALLGVIIQNRRKEATATPTTTPKPVQSSAEWRGGHNAATNEWVGRVNQRLEDHDKDIDGLQRFARAAHPDRDARDLVERPDSDR